MRVTTIKQINRKVVNAGVVANTEVNLIKNGWVQSEAGWLNPVSGVLQPGVQEVTPDPREAARIHNSVQKVKRGLEQVARRDYLMRRGWKQSAINNMVWTAPFTGKDKVFVKRTVAQAYKMQVRLDAKEKPNG